MWCCCAQAITTKSYAEENLEKEEDENHAENKSIIKGWSYSLDLGNTPTYDHWSYASEKTAGSAPALVCHSQDIPKYQKH